MASVYERGPYGRRPDRPGNGGAEPRRGGTGSADGTWRGETYYGRPAIKKSHWKWLIAQYFFVGGLAGAAQIIAAAADLVGHERDRGLVRAGRYLALFGALMSPIYLIWDLHTPSRWYNMLRIFRRTSPMNIGSWTLTVFGTLSGLAAAAQLLEDLTGRALGRRLARWSGIAAAGMGMLVSTYTGTLLSATSVPLWATGNRRLAALFGASGMTTAAAALSLILQTARGNHGARHSLERLAVLAGGFQLAVAMSLDEHWRRKGVGGPVEHQPKKTLYQLGVQGFGITVPVLIHASQLVTGWRSARASIIAPILVLLGGFLERVLLVFEGQSSAERPEDYFRMCQAEAMPSGGGLSAGRAAEMLGGQTR